MGADRVLVPDQKGRPGMRLFSQSHETGWHLAWSCGTQGCNGERVGVVHKEDDPLVSVVVQNQQLPTKGRIAERREVTVT